MIYAKDLYTENGEIVFFNDDLKIENNANYNLGECLMYSSFGEFKQNPLTGVNIRSFLNSPVNNIQLQILKNTVNQQLTKDGFSINDLVVKYNPQLLDYQVSTNCNRLR